MSLRSSANDIGNGSFCRFQTKLMLNLKTSREQNLIIIKKKTNFQEKKIVKEKVFRTDECLRFLAFSLRKKNLEIR